MITTANNTAEQKQEDDLLRQHDRPLTPHLAAAFLLAARGGKR